MGLPLGMRAARGRAAWVDGCAASVSTLDRRFRPSFSDCCLVFVFYYLLAGRRRRRPTRQHADAAGRHHGLWTIDAHPCGDLPLLGSGARPIGGCRWSPCLFGVGRFARMTRAACSEVLGSDYVRTAQPGPAQAQVLWTYAFRNALVPIPTRWAWCSRSCLRQCPGREVFGGPGRRLRDPGAAGVGTLPGARVCPGHGLFLSAVNLQSTLGSPPWPIRMAFDALAATPERGQGLEQVTTGLRATGWPSRWLGGWSPWDRGPGSHPLAMPLCSLAARRTAAAGAMHVFGTDIRPRYFQPCRGRDSGLDLGIAFAAVLISLGLEPAGAFAGWAGGWPDRIIGR